MGQKYVFGLSTCSYSHAFILVVYLIMIILSLCIFFVDLLIFLDTMVISTTIPLEMVEVVIRLKKNPQDG